MFLRPQKIIETLQILPGMKIADFGCGRGDFALAAARYTFQNGKVYALDVREGPLSFLRGTAKAGKFQNIETVRVDLEKPRFSTLRDASVHCIIISNVLHCLAAKETVAREAHRILEPAGKLAVIEWKELESHPYKKAALGPKHEARLTKEDAKQLFEIRGFSFDREFDAGDCHYGLIFKTL